MNIGLLIIGDEILTGRRQDKHLQHCIETLAKRGLELSWVRYSGDDEAGLSQQFEQIIAAGDICLSFGGIGATHDDRTRQSFARALQRPIERLPEAVAEIEARFAEQAYPYRVLMADVPQGARIIPNSYNRIPGFSVDHIHCLPGFPEMAWPMLEWVMDHHYPDLRAEHPVQYNLILEDAHESQLIDLMADFQQRHTQVKLSSLPRLLTDKSRQLELGIRGLEVDARPALDELKQLLQQHNYPYTESSNCE